MARFEVISDARIERLQEFQGRNGKRYQVRLSMRGAKDISVWTDLTNLREGMEGEARLENPDFETVTRVKVRDGQEFHDKYEYYRFQVLAAFAPRTAVK